MKRTPCLIVLVVAALGHPGIARAGAVGADRCTAPAADPVDASSVDASREVFEGCIDEAPSPPEASQDVAQSWARMKRCDEAGRAMVLEGTDADREWLWTRFGERSDDLQTAGRILDAFLDWHLERALAALEGSSSPALAPTAADVEMPDFLRDAPADLQGAWQTYQAVLQAQEADDAPPSGAPIPFHANHGAFRRTVAGFLQGRVPAAEAVPEMSRYEWGGGCGAGIGLLYVPRAKARVIAHLQAGRADRALAASGGIDAGPFGAGVPAARFDRRLVAAAGVDGESLHLGGVLSGSREMADNLARDGSERAGELLLAAARLMEPDTENDWREPSLLWPLAALVDSSGPCAGYAESYPSEVPRRCEAEPVSGDLQEDVLDLLAEKVGPDVGLREAGVASHLLLRLCRAESRPAFRAMLRSRYQQVREMGAIGLRAHGETFTDPRPSRAVAVRLIVDGQPARQRKVEWMLEWEEGQEWNSVDADDEGIVRLARDLFVDPTRRPTSMRLAAPDLASATEVWFAATLLPPADLDAVSTLSVRTGSLTVVIPPSLLAGAGQDPPTLQLIAQAAGDGSHDPPLLVGTNLPVTSTRIMFPHLQHGGYQVWLRGSTLPLSPVVEVGEQPATLVVDEEREED